MVTNFLFFMLEITSYKQNTLKSLILKDLLYVAYITKNLLRISKLVTDNDLIVEVSNDFCIVKDQRQRLLLVGMARGGLYLLEEKKRLKESQENLFPKPVLF